MEELFIVMVLFYAFATLNIFVFFFSDGVAQWLGRRSFAG